MLTSRLALIMGVAPLLCACAGQSVLVSRTPISVPADFKGRTSADLSAYLKTSMLRFEKKPNEDCVGDTGSWGQEFPDQCPATTTDSSPPPPREDMIDRYTRISIYPTMESQSDLARFFSPSNGYPNGVRLFSPQERSIDDVASDSLERVLFGTSQSGSVKLSVEVQNPNFKLSWILLNEELVTTSRDGRRWSRSSNSIDGKSGYFRVKQGSVIYPTGLVAISKDQDSDAARLGLDFVRDVAGMIAPGSSIVTSLNKDRLERKAQIVDDAFGRFMATRYLQPVTMQPIALDTWHPKDRARLRILLPATDGGTPVYVGTWDLRLDAPRASLFHNHAGKANETVGKIVDGIRKNVSPYAILNTMVDQNLTLGEKLRANAGVQIALENKNITNLCRTITSEMEKLEFNQVDGLLATWALAETVGADTRLADGVCGTIRATQLAKEGEASGLIE